MLLVIDSGNTNIVFAVYEGETRMGLWRAATGQPRTADDYAVWLSSLMEMQGLTSTQVTDAIICSVVPHALRELEQLCRQYFSCDPIIVSRKVGLGIDVAIDDPDPAGTDRHANAVAVSAKHGGSAIVLDFGNGTTFDIVDTAGNYCGGVVAPGINRSLKALHGAAAHLPQNALVRPEKVIGDRERGACRAIRRLLELYRPHRRAHYLHRERIRVIDEGHSNRWFGASVC
jgi:type III pantothenate kinase